MIDFLKKYYLELFSILLFLFLIPVFNLVNFRQNDDWVYYQNIQNILSGNFYWHEKTAPTFLTIGILASFWSLIFSIHSLPILTFVISILNFYFFVKILDIKFSFSKLTNILISLILFTNFLHIYSSIGFMTENYLIFFLLLSIFYFEKSEIGADSLKYLHVSNIFSIFTFFVKQSGILFLTSSVVYFLVKKDFKKFKIQSIYLLGIVLFYLFIFPKTSEMQSKNFNFENILAVDYLFSLSYGILIYLAFFTFPLILISFKKYFIENFKNIKTILWIIIIAISTYLISNLFFKPNLLAWQEFPYFENVIERTGFLPRTLSGTKYQFKFNFVYWKYADIVSKLAVVLSLTFILLSLKKSINVYSISIIGFIILMFFVSPFFDRYILYALPLSILFLCLFIGDNYFTKIVLIIFVAYQSFFSYFLLKDFVLSHNYIWKKSLEISQEIDPSEIKGSGGWKNTYGLNFNDPKYIFTYDSPAKNPDLKNNYNLLETKKIEFIGNLFINSEIYLYQKK